MKGQINSNKKDGYIAQKLTGILDVVICLILFITSIYKGAFYKSDFLFPNVIISFIGAIYLTYKIVKEITSKKDKRTKSKLKILLDTFMLFLPFTYLLPIVFKTYVSLPDSIYEMLRYVNMTVIYFIVRCSNNEKMYLKILVLISVVQMILGIDQLTFRAFEEFLNELSTGYLEDKERLSGTIQYANITGIIILFGMIICFNNISKILKKESKNKYIELVVCIFITLLGIFAISLTKSRVAMAVALGVLTIDSLFNIIYIDKKSGIYKLILTAYSLVISGVLEKYILNGSYSYIYIGLIIFTLIFIIIFEIIILIIKTLKNKVNIKKKIFNFNRSYIKAIIIVLFVIIFIAILFIPKDIRVSTKDNETIKISRSIFNFKTGKNDIEFKVDTLKEDTRFTIEIKEIDDRYKDNIIATYNYYDNRSGNFKQEINVSQNVRKLVVDITVKKGDIKIKNFKLNGNSIPLSYLFIPDSIVFKVRDTFSGVYGDTLRLEYAKDTFKLMKQSPIIGVGGEGFKHTYGSVQSIGYVSSEAHSALLQALVEVGIIGASILGCIILLSIILVIKLFIRLKKLTFDEKNYVMKLILIYLAFLAITIFDLALSYALMIYLFAVILALLLKAYIDSITKYNERKLIESKIDWSYIRIIVLSLSAVIFFFTTYFSFNAYRASLVKAPNKGEELSAKEVSENIAYLELKNKQDRFDIDYMRELNEEYNKYKVLITEAHVNALNDKELKEELNKELANIIIKIKENTDKMLEYEYYDKYVLNEVADVYIYNFVNFADIYKEQFSSEEVAYTFYLNYAIKLTDRIIELNPLSKKANEMYIEMCTNYIDELKKDDKYLNSNAIKKAISEFEKRLD